MRSRARARTRPRRRRAVADAPLQEQRLERVEHSVPQRSASENDAAPTGVSMNSWSSSSLSRVRAAVDHVHHRHRQHVGVRAAERSATAAGPARSAAAWATASETPRIAFAPSEDLSGVPSRSSSSRSTPRWSSASSPTQRRGDHALDVGDRRSARPCRRTARGRRRAARGPRARRWRRRRAPRHGRRRRRRGARRPRRWDCRANRGSRARQGLRSQA